MKKVERKKIKIKIEKCPCGAAVSELALMGYPIGEEPHLWDVYCTKCGFGSAAQDSIPKAVMEWCSIVKRINENKEMIRKNRDDLIKRGAI